MNILLGSQCFSGIDQFSVTFAGKRKQQEKKANRIAEVSDDSDIDVEDASGSDSSELSQPEPGEDRKHCLAS